MARLSKVVANEKKAKLVAKYRERRVELRKKSKDMTLNDEERAEARYKLSKFPRNSAEVRYRNRCALTGRARGFYRKFRLSRIAFRELALSGMIPGVTKSSW
jgi:small subunit ribosomal protein S14